MNKYLVSLIFIALSGCGGGGGGSNTDSPVTQNPGQPPSPSGEMPGENNGFLSFDRTQLTLQGFSDDYARPKANLRITTRDEINQQISAQISSSGLGVHEVFIKKIDAKNYDATIVFENNLPPGNHSGFFDINLCQDASGTCAQKYGNGPSRIAYSIKVSPPSDLRPLEKFTGITWTRSEGDSNNSRYIDVAIDTENISKRWQYTFPKTELWHQLRVAESKVFVLSGIQAPWGTMIGSTLRAFDEKSGALLWEAKFDDYLKSITIRKGEVIILDDRELMVHKFDMASGTRSISSFAPLHASTHRGGIELYKDGYLGAFSLGFNSYGPIRDSAISYKSTDGGGWIKDNYYVLFSDQPGAQSAFLKTDDTIYAKVARYDYETVGIVALSPKDGSEKFFSPAPLNKDSPLFILNSEICGVDYLFKIYCFDKNSGNIKFSVAEAGHLFSASPNSLLVSDGQYATWRNASTGLAEFTWGTPQDPRYRSSGGDVLMFKDTAFITSSQFIAIKKGDKEPAWKYSGGVVRMDVSEYGVLYAIGEGRLLAFNLK